MEARRERTTAEVMVDGLVRGALSALGRFETFTQEQVDHIVKKASLAALSEHGELARLAVEETGRGLFEDKAVKNLFACEHVVHSMRGLKTAGVIGRDELNGITEIAEPVGRRLRDDPGHQPHLDHHLQGADRAEDP